MEQMSAQLVLVIVWFSAFYMVPATLFLRMDITDRRELLPLAYTYTSFFYTLNAIFREALYQYLEYWITNGPTQQ